jgi:transcriptional regulator with GAF, ATPase, and Fis domain
MVRRKEFRSDLYYRLNVYPIELPPLRERRDDILQLVRHFVEIFARRMHKRIDRLPDGTLDAFRLYSWPGNIRELQNMVERAVILSNDGELPNPLPAHRPESVSIGRIKPALMQTAASRALTNSNQVAGTYQSTIRDSERVLILQALHNAGWVIGGPKGAAALLGLKRTTLITKMRKFGISRPEREFELCEVRDGTF